MKAVILGAVPLHPTQLSRPLYSPKVSAGQSRFASAAQGYELESLDLNQRYIVNPPATFLVRCEGDSMTDAGIHPGAILVVDKSISPKSGHIVIAEVDGEFLVKRLYKRGQITRLLSENKAHAPIELIDGQELVVWGVVTAVINELYAPYFRTR
jgi:DNA polymerase V